MIDDKLIDKVIERLTDRVEKANTYILKEIARSIKKLGTINPTKAEQLIQMLKYGGDFDDIIKRLSKYTNANVKDIYKVFDEVARTDQRFAKQFYDYRNKPFIPYEQNTLLKNQVRALANITAEEYINITNTSTLGFGMQDAYGNITYKGLKEAYSDLLDEAVLSVSQGKETFDNAMFRQLKEMGSGGLRVIYPTTYVDKNGIEKHYTRRLDSAVRMNMKSALRNLRNEMQLELGKEFDSDGVEISVHDNPAEDHADAQGRQFSNEEYQKLQTTGIATTYDNIHIDMHKGKSFRPISEWNCYHYIFSIVLGVSDPRYSNEELKKIKEDNDKGFELDGKHYTLYQGTQMQRQLETEIRRQKDAQIMGVEADNKELIYDSQAKITALTKKYKELSNASGLATRMERLKVEGYRRQNGKGIKRD